MEISWQLDNVTHSPHTADKWLRATSKQGRDTPPWAAEQMALTWH